MLKKRWMLSESNFLLSKASKLFVVVKISRGQLGPEILLLYYIVVLLQCIHVYILKWKEICKLINKINWNFGNLINFFCLPLP